ncbi:hypothetical protein OUZ56_033408 [Daphnia magna]|uniref:Uncharacterized protein n=1 Tax=Daphnia magna TaxID=35525 RepID=A0ABR0BAN7_9CRUS|nr:hypothetical protein OUZ56_033408 [Daphnia magna]
MEWFRNYSRERFTSDARRSNRNPGDAQKQICERKSNRYGNAEKPLLTMGDLPLAVISLPAKEETEDTVLVSNERQEIPAYSIKPVPTKLEGTCVLKPSVSLMAMPGLSTGHALVQKDL